jgi:hypothetical protein
VTLFEELEGVHSLQPVPVLVRSDRWTEIDTGVGFVIVTEERRKKDLRLRK